MTTKVTLKTLATTLGLSITTVSRALAGYSDVSPKTRERVRLTAEKIGYIPNQSARRLVTGRSNAVGIVLPFPGNDDIDPYVTDPFVNELLRYIARALQRLSQLDLIVGYSHGDDDRLNIYKRFVQGHRVDAFFVARTDSHDERIDYLLQQGIPFVCHGRTERDDQHAWVDTDARRSFSDITRHLLALRHRRIALLNIPAHYHTARLRTAGYTETMQAAALEPVAVHCELRMHSGHEASLTLLQSARPPTALLCASDIIAVGAMQAVRSLNLTPGREVSVIGTDNLPLAQLLEPELSSLGYSFMRLGEIMVDMLQEQLSEHKIIPARKLIEYQLLKRGSLGPCAHA